MNYRQAMGEQQAGMGQLGAERLLSLEGIRSDIQQRLAILEKQSEAFREAEKQQQSREHEAFRLRSALEGLDGPVPVPPGIQ